MSYVIRILVALVALVPSAALSRTVADLFASEPGKVFPLLTRTNRLDLVDYYNNGQKVPLQNNLAGTSQFIEMDSDYLKLQSSGSKVVEMRMITAGKDTVVAVIETVMTPVPDSRISFWNAQWEPLRADKWFKMPVIDDFLARKMPRELRADLRDAMVFPLIRLTFKGGSHDIIEASHGLQQFLAADVYKRFADYLVPSINYQLSGKKFKVVK